MSDIVERIRSLRYVHVPQASQLFEEACEAIESLRLEVASLLYDEWKRLHCGPRRMVSLIRKPYWKKVLSVPWLWWTHFGTACQHATVFQSARLATLFVWAFLKPRK